VSDGSATDRIGGRAILGYTAAALLVRPLRVSSCNDREHHHPNASLQAQPQPRHGAADRHALSKEPNARHSRSKLEHEEEEEEAAESGSLRPPSESTTDLASPVQRAG